MEMKQKQKTRYDKVQIGCGLYNISLNIHMYFTEEKKKEIIIMEITAIGHISLNIRFNFHFNLLEKLRMIFYNDIYSSFSFCS